MSKFNTLYNQIIAEKEGKSVANFQEEFSKLDPEKQSKLKKTASNYLKDKGHEDIGSSDISNQLMSWYKSYGFNLNAVLEDLVESVEKKKDYITVEVKIKMENGDSYTTEFNISDHLLKGTTPEEVVRKYFVGRPYTYSDESSSKIVSAEII